MAAQDTFLVFGATGWIGGKVKALLEAEGAKVVAAKTRLEDRKGIEAELAAVQPTVVLNAAGLTGRPNVDWCESHKTETVETNVVGTLNLAAATHAAGIHLTNFATGCIYSYDDAHPEGSGVGFREEEPPNFAGSFYSHTKVIAEQLLAHYDNILTLRLRMPISDDLFHRSFVTKISKYERVVNIPNSMTILHDLLPIAIDMSRRRLKGVYNFTNPGTLSHNEVLALYKEHIDPGFAWKNFTLEEQAKILAAPRSNNELDVSKLVAEYPDLPPAKESIVRVFQRMAVNLGKSK